jgi:hypothetical protein
MYMYRTDEGESGKREIVFPEIFGRDSL